jgi:hypothetical protein
MREERGQASVEWIGLVLLEPLRGKSRYRPLAKEVKPPWEKRPYRHPDSDSS